MKIIWESQDIRSGRILGKPERKERWMIGYIPEKHKRCLISLSDGMVQLFDTDADLATNLSNSGELPNELLK